MALLALAVMAIGAVTALQNKRMELKRESGVAEATVMEGLRRAGQALVDEQLVAIQRGQVLTKNSVVLEPTPRSDGELSWSPSVAQLRDMGYLPAGWAATRSLLNDGAYMVSFRRTPTACLGPACDVVGEVVLAAPLRDVARHAAVDGVLIGPILTRSGADGGVSLPTNPGEITGFNGTWRAPNPVPGAPPGVVAMRFGSQASGLSQFVRIADDRDPRLAGDLSVAGQGRFAGAMSVQGRVALGGDDTNPCVTVEPDGRLSIGCDGSLSATRAGFTGPTGGTVDIDDTGIRTNRQIESQGGLRTANASVFTSAEPTTIAVQGGPLTLRSDTATLANFQDGSLALPRNVVAERLVLRGSVTEGQPCDGTAAPADTGTPYGVTSEGSLAACLSGRWIVAHRFAAHGSSCPTEGMIASNSADGQALICRSGQYVGMRTFVSNFVLQQTLALQIQTGRTAVNKPNCAIEAGMASEPLIFIVPNNEDALLSPSAPTSISGVNRYAIDEGDRWSVVLERSADSSGLQGVVIAQIYCYYGSRL